ncbi:MAG: tripartite tricarboxylate transporter TctB family protein [Bacteroidetes bacterium]|nr:tripartite tricarboxylate transporter TctB family protein [Bacteroidota bacterium]
MKGQHKETAKPDFIAAVVLIILSLTILGISLAMPKYVEWGLYATPSLAPTIFSILLLFCSLILLIRSIAARGYAIRLTKAQFLLFIKSKTLHHFLAAFGFVILYYLLIGRIHFVLVSTLYLFLNILYFRGVKWWKNLIISTVTAVVIWYCFNYLFLIPLP